MTRKIFQAGSGVMWLNSHDQKKYGNRLEFIGQVSDAIASHNIETMKELLDQCDVMKMPRAAKRLRQALEDLGVLHIAER